MSKPVLRQWYQCSGSVISNPHPIHVSSPRRPKQYRRLSLPLIHGKEQRETHHRPHMPTYSQGSGMYQSLFTSSTSLFTSSELDPSTSPPQKGKVNPMQVTLSLRAYFWGSRLKRVPCVSTRSRSTSRPLNMSSQVLSIPTLFTPTLC